MDHKTASEAIFHKRKALLEENTKPEGNTTKDKLRNCCGEKISYGKNTPEFSPTFNNKRTREEEAILVFCFKFTHNAPLRA